MLLHLLLLLWFMLLDVLLWPLDVIDLGPGGFGAVVGAALGHEDGPEMGEAAVLVVVVVAGVAHRGVDMVVGEEGEKMAPEMPYPVFFFFFFVLRRGIESSFRDEREARKLPETYARPRPVRAYSSGPDSEREFAARESENFFCQLAVRSSVRPSASCLAPVKLAPQCYSVDIQYSA